MRQDLYAYGFDHDLPFYQNETTIPNQKLVAEIITYFTDGEGARIFDARTIMNLSYKEVRGIDLDFERPEDIFAHLENLPLSDLERHALLGTILKWRGGYPQNNLNEKYQRVMAGIQKRFLAFPGDTPEKKFAQRDEKRAQQFEKLGIAFTNGIRYGVPADKIMAELEEEGIVSEKPFSNFDSLFQAAANQGVFGEFPSKHAFALRLSEVNYSFNQWLVAIKGWDNVDKEFYANHLTQQVFVEYLGYRQAQETLKKKVAQQRRESWHPAPVQMPLVAEQVKDEANAAPLATSEVPSDLVFVTYCWESELHQERVRSLTKTLMESGENATMDIKEMQGETALQLKTMMLRNIKYASKVIVVLSKGYKEKAESEKGGVFFEYKAILEEIDKFPKKYVLVSFEPFNPELLPLGLAGRVVLTIDNQAGLTSLLHKLRDVDEFEFGPVATIKPELKARVIGPLFPKAESAAVTAQLPTPVLTIAEEMLPESTLPSDEHWVIHCLNAPAVQVYARLWIDEKKNLGSKWATIPSLEPGHQKELMWIRHCDIIELAWSDITGTKFYSLRIKDRKPDTKEITKEEFHAATANVGSNNDFLNRALVEFLRSFNLDLTKLPYTNYEYFLRAHNMLLPS